MKLKLITIPEILAIFLIAGCTTIDSHSRIDGWPELKTTAHYLPHKEMREICTQYAPPLMSPEACTVVDLCKLTCDMFYSRDFPPPQYIIEHEELHCQGYEHPGDTTLRDLLQRRLSQPSICGPTAREYALPTLQPQ